jgi:hypothetical protein
MYRETNITDRDVAGFSDDVAGQKHKFVAVVPIFTAQNDRFFVQDTQALIK